MRKIAVFLAASAAIVSSAAAGTVDYTDLTVGQMSVSFLSGGITVTATAFDAPFAQKSAGTPGNMSGYGEITGVGISGGGAGNEIDNNTQWIRLDFSQAVAITRLNIGLLYNRGNFTDTIDEVAYFVINQVAPPPPVYGANTPSFTATGLSTGSLAGDFSGTASYTNLSFSADGNHSSPQGGGGWSIHDSANIFNVGVTSIYLLPQHSPSGEPESAIYSDFVFSHLEFTAIPTPMAASAGLLGLTLVGARRRRNG